MKLMVIRVAGVLFMLGGVFLYALLAEVDTVSCDRATDVCVVTRGATLRGSTQSFAVADLTGAELETEAPQNRRSKTVNSRVVLQTKKGPVAFMQWFTNVAPGEMAEQVAAVNRYAATPSTARLDLQHSERVGGLVGGGVLLLGGLGLVVSSVLLKPILSRAP